MSRILIDDRVDQAAQQESARAGGQFMRDPNDVLRPPECLKRRRNALVAGTCIVEPDQIGMFVEEGCGQRAGLLTVVAPLASRQHDEVAIFARQNLVKSEVPLGVIAQRHRADDAAVRPAAGLSIPT